MAMVDPHWAQGIEGYNRYRASVGLPPITIEQAGGGNSLLGKIGRTGVGIMAGAAGASLGAGAAGGGAAGGTGGTVAGAAKQGVGSKIMGALGMGGQPGAGGGGFWSQYGPQIASAGMGILGNVLQSKASNQPEEWRQKLIEEELQRRNAYENAAIPSLIGALGYRSPQAGQQLIGQLGKYR